MAWVTGGATAVSTAPPFPPTDEQAAAVDLFRRGDDVAIEAGAGTGKTSTLLLLAGDAPRRRGQYIAFNRAIVTEASQKFPPHVACSTAHSLAWRAVVRGTKFADRLQSARMRTSDLARHLGITELSVNVDGTQKSLWPWTLGNLVQNAVTSFCQSADAEPSIQHVPYLEGIDLDGSATNNLRVARHILPAVRRMWADLQREGGVLPYRHEHYLKAWQLSGPRIDTDCIFFDEAQDANPVLLAIVEAQTHAQRVWVGDSQQQIYEFTGAVNALAKVSASQRTFLTQSFRFGQDIADVANEVLDHLAADLRLRGCERVSKVERVAAPHVVLSRTNAEAVSRLISEARMGRRAHLLGGGSDVLSFVGAAEQLQGGVGTSHPELMVFRSWPEVVDYVDHDAGGKDLQLLVKLVERFGAQTIRRALEGMPPEDRADVILSTAHKAKGREWASVQLAGDFDPREDEGLSPAELRLLYVGVTRGKDALDVTRVGFFERDPDATVDATTQPQLELVSEAPSLPLGPLPGDTVERWWVIEDLVDGRWQSFHLPFATDDIAARTALRGLNRGHWRLVEIPAGQARDNLAQATATANRIFAEL